MLDFSGPGKPTDNSFIESFNGKFRAECLNTPWFMSLDPGRFQFALAQIRGTRQTSTAGNAA
ncbi:hypothetical protein AA15237_0414 [Komagataeibacter xylinus NBRC 15237]|nr:hypothetical protein AA15237_0414 [Komagataeibacter xylinus NBRC 15237]